jgi:hypothetical protein
MRLPLAFAASLAAGTVIIAEEPAIDPDPIELTSFQSGNRLVKGAGDAAYSGINLIDRQLANVALAVSEENRQVWISMDPEVSTPIRIMQGWPQSRIRFADWTFPVDPDPSQFTLAPDADDVLLQIPKPRHAATLAQAWEPGAEEREVQPSGSPARKRLLLFLATVSIIAGPKPVPFLTRP